MLNMLGTIAYILAQTASQKAATLAGVGCVAVLFMVLCMDKSTFSKKQKVLLLVFMSIFLAAFAVLYFVIYR